MRWLVLVSVLAACHADRQVPVAEPIAPRPGDPIPPGGAPTEAVRVVAEVGPAGPAAMVAGRRRGVPHAGQIVAVVASSGGDRVLSRDGLGGVRVWPALDGSVEPQVLPVRAPEAMAIAARPDGSLAAAIDASGTLSVFQLDGEGLVRSTVTVPPDVPFQGVAILDGGERVAAVRTDHRIVLLDADGRELSRLGVRGARLVALHASGDGLVAILRRAKDDEAGFEVRRLAIAGDGLAWTGQARALPDPVASLPHVASAVSPDGALLAYMASTEGGAEVRIVEIATGTTIPLDGPAATSVPAATMLGWTADRRAEMAAFGGNGWRIDVAGGKATAISQANPTGTSTAAFAPGLRISGHQGHLALREADGDLHFLGHRELYAQSSALAPDGQSVAWVTSTGALVVQRFDGSDDVRIKTGTDYFGYAAIVDDGHVLAGRNNGQLALFDSRTGTEVAAMVASASTPWFLYEPSTGYAAVLRDPGTVWLIRVDPTAAEPLGAPIAVSDGAANFTLLDPDLAGGAVLMTVDSAQKARRYTLDELADGLSAAELKKERVATGAGAWGFDRRGRAYVVTGTSVEIRDGDKTSAIHTSKHGVHGVFPAPRGDRVVVLAASASGVASARGLDGGGKELWTITAQRGVFSVTWAADGSRAVVHTQGTAAVVDGATGALVARGAGWAFGLGTELPAASPVNIESEHGVDSKLNERRVDEARISRVSSAPSITRWAVVSRTRASGGSHFGISHRVVSMPPPAAGAPSRLAPRSAWSARTRRGRAAAAS